LPPDTALASRRRRRLFGLVLLVLFVLGVFWIQHLTRDDPATLISGDELQARMASDSPPLILDVRTLPEHQSGHIPGAYYLDYRLIGNRIPALREVAPQEIVLYCETGVRSRIAKHQLIRAGVPNVYHLDGDIRRWRREQRPLTMGNDPR
jgi:rhodanese-related sulfurtransferase